MKIVSVVGARPNFMKIAPLTRAIDKHNKAAGHRSSIRQLLVHTGQHYDYEMSQVFFQDLELPKPDIYLGVGSGTHAEQTGKVMIEFEKVLLKENPDLVMVVGDVNSTLAAALAAVKVHIPVGHIEAGLRSYDRAMPEEINRLLTDHISDYLFTTSRYDDENLSREGIPPEKIFRVGNIMVDSLLHSRSLAQRSEILQHLRLEKHAYALVTLHRPSNVDNKETLKDIFEAVIEVAKRTKVVFPVHPRTQKRLREFNLHFPTSATILIIPPLGYLDFLNLEMNARLVITDSGGIQVETTVLNIPCLTLLNSPVWGVTHELGTNILVGSDRRKLIEEASRILDSSPKTQHGSKIDLWDGKTAERIIGILARIPQLNMTKETK